MKTKTTYIADDGSEWPSAPEATKRDAVFAVAKWLYEHPDVESTPLDDLINVVDVINNKYDFLLK